MLLSVPTFTAEKSCRTDIDVLLIVRFVVSFSKTFVVASLMGLMKEILLLPGASMGSTGSLSSNDYPGDDEWTVFSGPGSPNLGLFMDIFAL